MAQTIREVMTSNPKTCSATASIADAARMMRDGDVGDVLVERDGNLCGIVTDRDIVVRSIAEGQDPQGSTVGDICSMELVSLAPTDTVEDAIRMMRDKAIRRVPVVEGGKAVGVVSIGDLAIERDASSALADVSAARPND